MTEAVARLRVPVTEDVVLSAFPRRLEDLRGAPFLLVHGLASNARMWDGVGEELARLGHPSIAIDQRGHGRASKPDDGYDFGTLTNDLLAVIDEMDIDPPIVVGQSWGGNVVMELAARSPGPRAWRRRRSTAARSSCPRVLPDVGAGGDRPRAARPAGHARSRSSRPGSDGRTLTGPRPGSRAPSPTSRSSVMARSHRG